jgi:hypothetical protein
MSEAEVECKALKIIEGIVINNSFSSNISSKDFVYSHKMNFCATHFIRINVFVGANKFVLVDCYVQLLFRSLAEKKIYKIFNESQFLRAGCS